MNENLVQRISELPICEDVDNIDVLLGVGSDGKTYRINKGDIKSGVEMIDIPLTGKYYIPNMQDISVSVSSYVSGFSVYIMTFSDEVIELLELGGTIHFLLNDGMFIHDISYDISNNKKCIVDSLFKTDNDGDNYKYGMIFFNLDLDNKTLMNLYPELGLCGQNCLMIQMEIKASVDDEFGAKSLSDNSVKAFDNSGENYADITDEAFISQMLVKIPDVNNVVGIYFEPKPIVNTYVAKEIDFSNIQETKN